MKVVVFGQEHIGYHVPDKLYDKFEKVRQKVDFDMGSDDDPNALLYFTIRAKIAKCKAFYIDRILTGDE